MSTFITGVTNVPCMADTIIVTNKDLDCKGVDFGGRKVIFEGNRYGVGKHDKLEYLKNGIVQNESLSYLFDRDEHLHTFDLDCSKLKDAYSMFSGCTALENVNLHSCNNIETASYMFSNCDSLKTIRLGDFNKCTRIYNMFLNCDSLDLVEFGDVPLISEFDALFSGTYNVNKFIIGKTAIKNFLDGMGDMTQYVGGGTRFSEMQVGDCPELTATSYFISTPTQTFSLQTSLKKLKVGDCPKCQSLSYAFPDFWHLEDVQFGTIGNMVSMLYTFSGCQNLTSFTIANTSKVKVNDASHAFTNATLVDDSIVNQFDFSTVSGDVESTFCNTKITVPYITANTKISSAKNLYSGTKLNGSVSLGDFPALTNAEGMFANCSDITALSIGNIPLVTKFSDFAYNCANLESITLGDCGKIGGTTGSVSLSMSDCPKLKKLTFSGDTSFPLNNLISTQNLCNTSITEVYFHKYPSDHNIGRTIKKVVVEDASNKTGLLSISNDTNFYGMNAEDVTINNLACSAFGFTFGTTTALTLTNSKDNHISSLGLYGNGVVPKKVDIGDIWADQISFQRLNFVDNTVPKFTTKFAVQSGVADAEYHIASESTGDIDIKSKSKLIDGDLGTVNRMFITDVQKIDNKSTSASMTYLAVYNTSGLTDLNLGNCPDLTYINLSGGASALTACTLTASPMSAISLFSGCTGLTTTPKISLDRAEVIDNFMKNSNVNVGDLTVNMANIISMSGAFQNASGVTSLTITNFKTPSSQSAKTAGAFMCPNLKKIDFSVSPDTDNSFFTYNNMFPVSSATGLQSIKIKARRFYNTSRYRADDIDVQIYKSSSVGGYEQTPALYLEATNSINVASEDYENVGLSGKSITANLPLINKSFSIGRNVEQIYLNIPNYKALDSMFTGCTELTKARVFSNSASTFVGIFSGCSKLKYAFLSETSYPTNTYGINPLENMFKGCSALEDIRVKKFKAVSGTSVTLDLSASPNLTDESLLSLAYALTPSGTTFNEGLYGTISNTGFTSSVDPEHDGYTLYTISTHTNKTKIVIPLATAGAVLPIKFKVPEGHSGGYIKIGNYNIAPPSSGDGWVDLYNLNLGSMGPSTPVGNVTWLPYNWYSDNYSTGESICIALKTNPSTANTYTKITAFTRVNLHADVLARNSKALSLLKSKGVPLSITTQALPEITSVDNQLLDEDDMLSISANCNINVLSSGKIKNTSSDSVTVNFVTWVNGNYAYYKNQVFTAGQTKQITYSKTSGLSFTTV